ETSGSRSRGQTLPRRAWHLLRTYLPAILIFVVVTVAWEAVVRYFSINVFLLPAPLRIFNAFGERSSLLFEYGMNTFAEALGGFAIGCGLGILIAIVAARWTILADLLLPLSVASN